MQSLKMSDVPKAVQLRPEHSPSSGMNHLMLLELNPGSSHTETGLVYLPLWPCAEGVYLRE